MAEGYTWNDMRGRPAYRQSGSDPLMIWAAIAMLISVVLHVIVFFALDQVKVALGFEEPEELSTEPVRVQRVDDQPYQPAISQPPEERTITPPDDAAALLDEVDLLEMLPDTAEIDIQPSALEPEYALQMSNPLAEGDPAATAMEISSGLDVASELDTLGRFETDLPPAKIGQITVDPGRVDMDDASLSKFTEDLIKKGAGGQAERGSLDGATSLDDMVNLPPNLLLNKKTLLPSDLLFEFNSAELRESAKVGLMKLALLIDRNPTLYCWIEGHSDLIGSDAFNLELSRNRAEAVKSYLVESLRMNPERIRTQGLGRSQPIVSQGSREEQAPNRRVEIRMRKTPPPASQPPKVTPAPGAAVPAETPPPKASPVPAPAKEPAPPKAVLVRPNVTYPTERLAPEATPPQRALPVQEEAPPRAGIVAPEELPAPEAPRAAIPVPAEPEAAPRALPVEP